MRPRRRKILVLVAAALALVGSALALGLFPQEPLRRIAERQLRGATGPAARLGGLRLVPGLLQAELRDLVLETQSFRLEVSRLALELEPNILFGGPLALASLELERPRLHLRPAAESGDGSAPPLLPVVRRLTLSDGELVYEDREAGTLKLSGLSARGGLGAAPLEIAASGGAFERGPASVPLRRLAGRLRVSPRLDLELDAFELRAGGSRLAASGRLARLATLDAELRCELDLDLADAGALGGTAGLSGVLASRATIRGRAPQLTVEASVTADGLDLAGWPVRSLRVQLDHDAVQERTSARLRAEALGGRLEADAERRGSASQASLRLIEIPLEALRRSAQLEGGPLHGTLSGRLQASGDLAASLRLEAWLTASHAQQALAGRMNAEAQGSLRVADAALDLSWTLDAEGSGSATAPFGAYRLSAKGTAQGATPPAIEATVDGSAELLTPTGPEGVELSAQLRAQAGTAMAEVKARGLGGNLQLDARLDEGRLERLDLTGDGLSLASLRSDLAGRIDLRLEAKGPAERLSVAGRAGIQDLEVGGVKLGAIALTLDGLAAAPLWTLNVPALSLEGRGSLAAGPPRRLLGTFELASTPLAPLAPLVFEGLEGALVGSVELDVPLSGPEAPRAEVRLVSGELARGPWSVRLVKPARLALSGSSVELGELSLEGHGATLDVSGRLGTGASDPLDLAVESDLDLASFPWPVGWEASGRASAALKLSGSSARPEARGQILLQELSTRGPDQPPLALSEARIELAGREARLAETEVSLAGGRVLLSGLLPFSWLAPAGADASSGEAARAELTWQGIQARTLLEQMNPTEPAVVEATLAGRLELEADEASLRGLRGHLQLEPTRLGIQDLPATLEAASLRLHEGRLESDGVTLETHGGRITASGALNLLERRLDLRAHGALALRALSPFLEATSLAGVAELDLRASGSFDAPETTGELLLRDGSLRMRDIPQALSEIDAKLLFDASTLRIERGSAVLGGGTLTLGGGARISGTTLSDVQVSLTGRDMALRYPPGFKSRIDADLTLTGKSDALLLSGEVRASRGLYDLDLALAESFRAVEERVPESPLLRSIALDLRVETPSPVRVKNNIADLQATARLTLRGDMQEPAPFGRLELLSGGKLFLQSRSFVIDSGQLEYAGTWDATVNVSARTQIRALPSDSYDRSQDVEYAIGVEAGGTLERPTVNFTSNPSLSQPEIVSLIATGRTRSEALRSSGWVVGEQAATLLAGSLTRGVSETLRGLGLDEVSIQPELLAREANPGARFTFGKQFGPLIRLIYSLSLNRPEDRFVQVEGRPGLSLTATVQRGDDGTFTYGLGQRLEWGGARPRAEAAREERVRVGDVRLESDASLEEDVLRQALKLEAGDRATAWQVQEAAERLRTRLRDLGHLEAEVGARLEDGAAVFRVRAGARYDWRVEGMTDPPDLSGAIRKALFEEEALEQGRERLLATLHLRGHLRASIEARAEGDELARSLVFHVTPGVAYADVDVRFPGASALPRSRLIRAAGGAAALLEAPREAVARLEQAYHEHHYLAAQVEPPQVSESGERLEIRVPVREGAPARVTSLSFEDASRPTEELAAVAGVEIGTLFDPDRAALAAVRVRDHYLGQGYPSARVVASARPEGADVALVFGVSEGPRVTIGAIEVVGTSRTRESLVRGQIALQPGDPLDPRKLGAVERRLLDLGMFSRAAIVPSPENPTTLRVELEERRRIRTGYEVRYSDKEKATAQLDAEVGNVFGRGLALGGRLRAGRDVREARGSLFLPAVGAGDLVGSLFQREEDFAAVDPFTLEPLEATRVERGFQIQQKLKLPDRWNLLYGYSFERDSVRPISRDPFNIAAIETSLVRDTRDNPLNARRGRFWSASLTYSPSWVGSDFTFVSGLAQAFITRSLRPSLVWAQGYRLGLATGFGGQRLVFSERFRAGGANTIRGFAAESLGPRDFLGDPAGGQAVVVLNQELRYRHRLGLGAAVFYDTGNVFDTISDASFDLRHALGLGLRWDSPVGLLRIDVGFPVSREPDEKSYQLFFGLGQAF